MAALMEETVEVTQADRDIAHEIMQIVRGYRVNLPNDRHWLIDIVARHRLAHSEPRPVAGEVREVIAEIIKPAAYSETFVKRKAAVWGSEKDAADHQMLLRSDALAKADAILAALATHSPAPTEAGEVAIWSGEHRAYWRRGSRGEGASYTTNLDEAGMWSRADAVRLTSHCGPEKLIALHDRPSTQGGAEG